MDSGFGDQGTDMQQWGSTNVDTTLLGERIEVVSKYSDEDRELLAVWGKWKIIAIPVMKKRVNYRK